MTRHRGACLAALLLTAAAVLAGCGGGEPPEGVANVPMLDNFYARDVTRVPVGGTVRRPNAISITADGVAVENLTVRNALVNGVFWTGVRGYRASHVTVSNNKDYG